MAKQSVASEQTIDVLEIKVSVTRVISMINNLPSVLSVVIIIMESSNGRFRILHY